MLGLEYNIHKQTLATWLSAGCNLVLGEPLTLEALRDWFAGDLATDLGKVMSRSTPQQHSKAALMTTGQEFRNWIETPFSDMIHYNDDEIHQFNTPTTSSIICREVICSTQPGDGRLVLGFFGGLRRREFYNMLTLIKPNPHVRPFQDGTGLMRNLLLQLLLSIPAEFVHLPWTPGALAAGLIEDPGRTYELLYKLFDNLMFQAPAQEIIIVIDNIQHISGAGPSMATQLLTKVHAARNSQHNSKVLKLLMTNPLPEMREVMAATMRGFATMPQQS